MIHAGPLLAAGMEDLIRVLIVLAIILIPAIGQLINKLREAQREAAKRAAQQGRGGPRPAGPKRPRDAVEDEIGEFLRRAAERREAGPPQRPPQPAQARPKPQEPARRLVEASRPLAERTEVGPPPSPPAARPSPPVLVEVVEGPALGERVRKHVQQYLRTDDLAHHAEKLGEDLGQSDERLEARLRQTFDHELARIGRLPGELADEAAAEPAPAGTGEEEGLPAWAAAGFGALLANADSLCQAVVLNEILRRPEDRWT